MDIEPGTPVEIYWNLHKHVFSVRSRRPQDYGRVIAHVNSFLLEDVTFVVRAAGRQKVLQEQRKNVHAFVRGRWATEGKWLTEKVSYNPYKNETFVLSDGFPLQHATHAQGVTLGDETRKPLVTV